MFRLHNTCLCSCCNSQSKSLELSRFAMPPSSTSFRPCVASVPTPFLVLPLSPLSGVLRFSRLRGGHTRRTPPPPRDAQHGAVAQTRSSDAEWGEEFEWEIKGAWEEEVWAVTGDFVGVQRWVPNLLKSSERVAGQAQKPGCVRKSVLYPEPHTEVYEKLLSMDESRHHYTYTIVEDGTTAPGFSLMRDYVATFNLSSLGNGRGTRLSWAYKCRPVSTMSQADAHTTVFSVFQAAADALTIRLSLPNGSVTLVSK